MLSYMNSPRTEILRRIHEEIPYQILEYAFAPVLDQYGSIDRAIEAEVIDRSLLPEVNKWAGQDTYIVLLSTYLVRTNVKNYQALMQYGNFSTYRIPPDVRQNRPLVSVTSIMYPHHGNNHPTRSLAAMGNVTNHGQDLGGAARGVLGAQTFANAPSNPTPRLLNESMVELMPSQRMHIDWYLYCTLGYDREFTNMTKDAQIPLANLGLCMTKRWIYVNCRLNIGDARIMYGMEHPQFTQFIDSYADASERCAEMLNEFRSGTMVDPRYVIDVLSTYIPM